MVRSIPLKLDEYTPAAKALHWLIALLIFVLFPLGWFMDGFTGLQKFQAYNMHKSLGLTVLLLTVLRLAWRFFNPAPALPDSVPERQKRAAHGLHHTLYLTVFLIALAGWAMISASDKPSALFNLRPFPLLPWLSDLPVADKKFYHSIFEEAHGVLGWVLLVLLALHIGAALYHGIVLKDGIFSTMRPNFGKRSKTASAAFILLGAGVLAAGGGGKALASDWSVKPAESQIAFEATGGGNVTRGTVGQFRAEIEFDPDTPDKTSVRVLLDMNSAATGTADADETLRSADFFNPSQFPTAQFVARGAQAAGEGRYVLNGRLTLKGVTRPVALPFSIDIRSGTARVKAETTINRLDFGVGPESLAGIAMDKDVKLSINLTAVRLDD
jgi:cytochrome b561/polyisoprenoid-binding protein YceI